LVCWLLFTSVQWATAYICGLGSPVLLPQHVTSADYFPPSSVQWSGGALSPLIESSFPACLSATELLHWVLLSLPSTIPEDSASFPAEVVLCMQLTLPIEFLDLPNHSPRTTFLGMLLMPWLESLPLHNLPTTCRKKCLSLLPNLLAVPMVIVCWDRHTQLHWLCCTLAVPYFGSAPSILSPSG
jgi:hypothetical protein